MSEDPDNATAETACPRCHKPAGLCVCSAIEPIDNKLFVLILQHPQEQDRELGSAWIAHRQLKNSRLMVGLSWKGLATLLGRPADPRKWGVLYLGSAKLAATKAPGGAPPQPLVAVSARGTVLPDQAAVLGGLEGIIVLDGNWSQAKALWWRNPWLLKLRRLILVPEFRSLYGKLRREPRAESISTIEAIGLCLAALAGNPEMLTRMTRPFSLLLRHYKDRRKAG